MKNKLVAVLIACYSVLYVLASSQLNAQTLDLKNPYPKKVVKKISLPGDEKWDYLSIDETNRRLYIAHASQVQVLDLKKDSLVGTIPNLQGVHGVCFAPLLNLGFTSNGKSSSVTVFDLKTLKVIKEIDLKPKGEGPDAILYDEFSKQVFAFCGKSNNVLVIDPVKQAIKKDIPLEGNPEFAVSDKKGGIYVNIESKNMVVKFGSVEFQTLAKFALDPAEEPTGIDIDTEYDRLFVVCRGSKPSLQIINITPKHMNFGQAICSLPIGKGTDAVVVDNTNPAREIFCSNGDGTMTIVKQNDADDLEHFAVIQNLATPTGSKTMAFDKTTGKIYLGAAEFEGKKVKPNSFKVLVVTQ